MSAKRSTPKRAVIYVRISKDRDNQSSTDSQERSCRAYAESQGWEVVSVMVDQGKSAWNRNTKRPGFDEAMDIIERGGADVLLVWAIDRAVRSTIDLDQLLERLEDCGGNFVSATQPIDTTTKMGVAMLKIVGVLAELESGMKSERMVYAHQQRRLEGKPMGGPRPYGYQRTEDGTIVQDPAEAQTVRRVFKMFRDGESYNAIARTLNEEGLAPVTGARFHAQTVKDLTSSLAVNGRMTVEDVAIPAPWEAIIDDDEWNEVQDMKRVRPKMAGPQRKTALLTGMLVCGVCGANLWIGARRRYVCSGPECFNGVNERLADEYVSRVVIGSISKPAWDDMRAKADGADPAGALRAELEQMAADYGQGLITRAEWEAFRPALLERIEQAETVHVRRSDLPDVANLADAWDTLDVRQQRTVLRALVEQITVGPTRMTGRFEPDRFDIIDRF